MSPAKKSAKTRSESDLLKAIAHPLRFRILEELNKEATSPSVLAQRLNEPLANVSYHVQQLVKYDVIELAETRPVRGALEHIYRATARPYLEDEHWSKIPLSVRRSLFDRMLQGAWEHIVAAAESGGLDDPHSHISWTQLDLDAQGYQDVADLLAQTLQRALEIQAEAAGRQAESSEEEGLSERTELTIFHYHRPPAAKPSGRGSGKRRRRRPASAKAKAA